MADAFNPLWKNSPVPVPDLSGAGVTGRGCDPNAEGGDAGGSGLRPLWGDAPVGAMGNAETSNSVSGLPATPNRFEPSGEPPGPPDLTDRSPSENVAKG